MSERKRLTPDYDQSVIDRFMSHVEFSPDGCWHWTAYINIYGYGHFAVGRVERGAHRFAYEAFVGPIPDGLTIDHLCRVTHCVNPAHLEAVTNRENVLRGDTLPAANLRKTHCENGHLFDEANTLITEGGKRRCRACNRAKSNRAYARRRAAT